MSKKNKIFKTIDEQINILRSKGLVIDNEEQTRDLLIRDNFFFINGYRHLFLQEKNKFYLGTTFEELYATFIFDRRIRNIFFKNILIVENNIKSIISYQLSKKYGFRDKEYLDIKNFTQDQFDERRVKDVLSKVKRQIRINGNKHTATLHYIENYGYIPMWVLVKVLSFGIMAEFYSILKRDDKQAVASFYHINNDDLAKYLIILANFRNVCAHEDILYDHKTQKIIPNTIYHEKLGIEKNEEGIYIYGKNDLFGLVIMMKQLLRKKDFELMIDEIQAEVEKLNIYVKVIPLSRILNRIGFPDNWYDLKSM